MENKLTDADVEKLLNAALEINDKFCIHADHVEFTGGMNDAESFRELVNDLWHKWAGWKTEVGDANIS